MSGITVLNRQISYTDRLYRVTKRSTYHPLNGRGYGHLTF